MMAVRISILLLTVAVASGQAPGLYPWWNGPIARDLGLTEDQLRQIRDTVRSSRERMMQLRASVEAAEAELGNEMRSEQVDRLKAGDAIERVVGARAELTRAVAQMGLKLRLILTPAQWQELEKRQQMGPRRRFAPRGPGRARAGPE